MKKLELLGLKPRWGWGVMLIVSALVAGCSHKTAGDYVKAGDQARAENRVASAEEDYQAAVKAAPNDADAHLALGTLYLSERNYSFAQGELQKAVQLDPKLATAHAALARFYTVQSQFGPAEDQWRAAIALDPAAAAYYAQFGELKMRQGDSAEALRQLRTAAGLAPSDARIHLELANLLATVPNGSAEANQEYALARQLDPKLVAALPNPVAAPAPEAAPEAPMNASAPLAAAPAPAPATTTAAAPPQSRPIRTIKRRFLLAHDSPVNQDADENSAVIAHVHRRRWVNVTGITGNWLRIRLRNGTVGFIPTSAAE